MQIRWRPRGAPIPTLRISENAGDAGDSSDTSDSEHCGDGDGREPEWLVTNGIGGFAAGTVAGLHRRRYHGFLIASLQPPVRRCLLWAKTDEWIVRGDRSVPLGVNDYGDVVFPDGWRRLHHFTTYPFPTTTWLADGVRLERTVFMVRGQNTTVVLYTVHDAPSDLELRFDPFVNFRDYHHTARESGSKPAGMETWDGGVHVRMTPDAPALLLAGGCKEASRRLRFDVDAVWHRNFHYAIEKQRGLDFVEDHFRPGFFRWRPRGSGDRCVLVGHCDVPSPASPPPRPGDGEALLHWALGHYEGEVGRRARIALGIQELAPKAVSGDGSAQSPPDDRARSSSTFDPLRARLLLAADDFIVRRETTGAATVLAGYPWFADWGRDAMISLPGLLLSTRRFDVAKEVLLTFSAHRSDGLIPNRFPDDGGEPLYNAVDASLWFVWAAWHYDLHSGDAETTVRELLPVMEDVVKSYIRGTRHGIGMAKDGLVHASDPGLQLTWMDAKAGDWVVTPRAGAPVEVNALWYNALRTVATLKRRHEAGSAAPYEALARRVQRSFARAFVGRRGPEGGPRDGLHGSRYGGLYDVITGHSRAGEMRSNQIFAASLPFSPLSRPQGRRTVAVVARHLLTPVGLHTLAPEEEAYIGRYGGDQRRRDAAYHQGTVWPWLLGAFADGLRRVGGSGIGTEPLFRSLEAHLESEAALGHVSEIFAGDGPHPARGCFAQAWSVAEWLRVYDGSGVVAGT